MNQVIIRTVMGGAQPVAASLDYEEWPDVVGTIAGDDTVLVICADQRKGRAMSKNLALEDDVGVMTQSRSNSDPRSDRIRRRRTGFRLLLHAILDSQRHSARFRRSRGS